MVKVLKRPSVASKEVKKKRSKVKKKVSKATQKLLGEYSLSFVLKQGGIICAMLLGLYFIVTLAIDSYNYAVNEKGASEIPVIEASVEEIKFVPKDRGGLEIKNLDVNVYDVAVDRKDNKNVKQELAELKRDTIKPIAPEKAIKLESEENIVASVEISKVAFDDNNNIKSGKLDSVLREQNKIKTTSDNQSNDKKTVEQKIAKGLDGIGNSLEDLASGEVMVKAGVEVKANTVVKDKSKGVNNSENKLKLVENKSNKLSIENNEVKSNKNKEDVNKARESKSSEKNVDIDEYNNKKVVSNPIYRVQFASLRTKRNVEQYWNGLLVNYPDLFKSQPYIVEEVKVGTRGTFYRLKVGEFLDGDKARDFCDNYTVEAKRSKDSCLVVKSY